MYGSGWPGYGCWAYGVTKVAGIRLGVGYGTGSPSWPVAWGCIGKGAMKYWGNAYVGASPGLPVDMGYCPKKGG